jgi:hypothetical protein
MCRFPVLRNFTGANRAKLATLLGVSGLASAAWRRGNTQDVPVEILHQGNSVLADRQLAGGSMPKS